MRGVAARAKLAPIVEGACIMSLASAPPRAHAYAAEAARWAAVEARERAADGAFFTCVKTTGVYCLASCAGRPLRKNVVFAETREDAEAMGFRPCKRCRPERFGAGTLAARIDAFPWARIAEELDTQGFAVLEPLLSPEECARMIALYDNDALWRSRVVMRSHGFGEGEYRYFADPLPTPVSDLRRSLYEKLFGVANRWADRLGQAPFPADHGAYRARCRAAGQTRPTPLMLRYGPGGHNRLHQDLYGGEVFPIQATILLSEPGRDFDGGAFVLTEQRPRMQSRAEVVSLSRGEAVVFAVNERPVSGPRGVYRVRMRHGVSTVRSGSRHALGVIFHDAA